MTDKEGVLKNQLSGLQYLRIQVNVCNINMLATTALT